MGKILTLFFSKKGQTIGPGMKIRYQEKGNCNIAAEYIQEAAGGDLFEIQADRTYSDDHMKLIEEARYELEHDVRVPVKQYPENMDTYDTVFLVYPNWWNTIPMAVATFLQHFNWNGKVIIPVCTNEGSGLGDSVSDIRKYASGAKISNSKSYTGSKVSDMEKQIKEWAEQVVDQL